jgi:3',5'-cyclic AMP phosphodiesterase CpdA
MGDILVVGDWGSGTLPQGAVAGAMQRHAEVNEVEAILTTGDNFYSDDAEFLMQPFGWATENGIPFWITWGNHDIETDTRIDAVNQTFGSPPRWAVHEWGKMDVVVLDSNQVESDEQREFLIDALASTTDPTIVVFHHPPLSCSHHGDSRGVLERWVPVLDEDVILVLSGHDHNYQRFESKDVTYVVSGGGGRSLYELEDCAEGHPGRVAGEVAFHFLALSQDGGMTLTAYDVNGEEIDTVVFDD